MLKGVKGDVEPNKTFLREVRVPADGEFCGMKLAARFLGWGGGWGFGLEGGSGGVAS